MDLNLWDPKLCNVYNFTAFSHKCSLKVALTQEC